MTRLTALPLLLAAACAPQNASIVQGEFTAWLAATNSLTVARGDVDFDEFDQYLTIDCREFAAAGDDEAANELLRLPGRLDICPDFGEDSGPDWPPEHEIWADQNGFHVVSDTIEPWRGEGVITSEGDVQVGFHHRLPGGEDFRFLFTVNPDFQPRRCAQDDDGNVGYEDIDGDWLGEWSRDLPDGGTLFYLNSGASQFDPDNTESRWFIPREWRAGIADGKFGDDRFRARTPRYALPAVYITVESTDLFDVSISEEALFYCGDFLDPTGNDDPAESSFCAAEVERVEIVADEVAEELRQLGVRNVKGLPSGKPLVEDNLWRDWEGDAGGLDAWVGLHYNWVKFDAGSGFEKGDSASGEFNLMLDGSDTQSRMHIRGRFEVDRWKVDQWTLPDIAADKFEENGTELCGEPYTGR